MILQYNESKFVIDKVSMHLVSSSLHTSDIDKKDYCNTISVI